MTERQEQIVRPLVIDLKEEFESPMTSMIEIDDLSYELYLALKDIYEEDTSEIA